MADFAEDPRVEELPEDDSDDDVPGLVEPGANKEEEELEVRSNIRYLLEFRVYELVHRLSVWQ